MKYVSLITLLLTANHGLTQTNTLFGKYQSGHYFINFISDSTLEFNVNSGGCLTYDLYGYGKYKIIEDKVEVRTIKSDSEFDSKYQVVKDLNDSKRVVILIEDGKSEPLAYCNVLLKNRNSDELIVGMASNEIGIAIFDNLSLSQINECFIEVTSLWSAFEIPLSEVIGKSIKVTLSYHLVIQNERVVFNIKADSNSIETSGPEFIDRKVNRKPEFRWKTRVVFTKWPWNWNFKKAKHFHDSESTLFVRQ